MALKVQISQFWVLPPLLLIRNKISRSYKGSTMNWDIRTEKILRSTPRILRFLAASGMEPRTSEADALTTLKAVKGTLPLLRPGKVFLLD